MKKIHVLEVRLYEDPPNGDLVATMKVEEKEKDNTFSVVGVEFKGSKKFDSVRYRSVRLRLKNGENGEEDVHVVYYDFMDSPGRFKWAVAATLKAYLSAVRSVRRK